MKKSILYLIPVIPLLALYGIVFMADGAKSKEEDLGVKVKALEEKVSMQHRFQQRLPAATKLSQNQIEHLIRYKGCKVFNNQGQNILACPKTKQHFKRFI